MENLIVTASPHIRDKATTRSLMGYVAISLLPAVLASALIFGMRALVLVVAGILVYRLRVLRPKELARHNELEADKLQSRALLEEKRAEFAALGL